MGYSSCAKVPAREGPPEGKHLLRVSGAEFSDSTDSLHTGLTIFSLAFSFYTVASESIGAETLGFFESSSLPAALLRRRGAPPTYEAWALQVSRTNTSRSSILTYLFADSDKYLTFALGFVTGNSGRRDDNPLKKT